MFRYPRNYLGDNRGVSSTSSCVVKNFRILNSVRFDMLTGILNTMAEATSDISFIFKGLHLELLYVGTIKLL